MPSIHTFESTGDAYDTSQCCDQIKDGDVLYVPSENAIAILCKAWPVALTEAQRGKEFHRFENGADGWAEFPDYQGYAASVALAQTIVMGEQRPFFAGWVSPVTEMEG